MSRNVTTAGEPGRHKALQDATSGPTGDEHADTRQRRRKGREQKPTAEQLARAVALCSEDRLTDGQIAHQLGIARRTLARWKSDERWALLWLGVSAYVRLQGIRHIEARAEALAERLRARG